MAALATPATTEYDSPIRILHGDCLEVMRGLPSDSVSAVVTDPPYGLSAEPDMVEVLTAWLAGDRYEHHANGFMGKAWDAFLPGPEYWREVYRVLRPGGHLLCFAGTRTWDVMSVAIRLAGFENRDTIASQFGAVSALQWSHAQGFPKSLSVDKAIDRMAGAEREVIGIAADFTYDGKHVNPANHKSRPTMQVPGGDRWALPVTAPATDAAKQWSGWGSALKPAWEPVLVFRKPLAESSIAAQVLATGTGALNIGQSRVGSEGGTTKASPVKRSPTVSAYGSGINGGGVQAIAAGRYPPNLLFTHALACTPDACADECPVRVLDRQSGVSRGHKTVGSDERIQTSAYAGDGPAFSLGRHDDLNSYGDVGGASRFYPQFAPDAEATPDGDPLATLAAPFLYTSKASRRERNAGCEALPLGEPPASARSNPAPGRQAALGAPRTNHHPCVKPQSLMRWLATLICPPGGVILDPFAGSGSTGVAAAQLGYRAILIEREAEYLPIIAARVAWGLAHPLAPVAQVTQVVSAPPIATPLTPVTPRRRAKVAKPAKRLPSNIVALSLWEEAV